MPHVPYNFRPVPTGAVGVGGVASPTTVPVTDTTPIIDKPIVKKQPNPRRRTFAKKTGMRTLMTFDDIAEWDVSPKKIAKDMKLGG